MANPFTVISNLFGSKTAKAVPSKAHNVRTLTAPMQWQALTDAFNGYSSGTTSSKAMKVSTFYACVDRKSNDMAALPLRPIKTSPTGNTVAKDSDLYRLLNNPSPLFTKVTWQKTSNAHIDKNGECFTRIVRKNGIPVRFEIWHPSEVDHVIDDSGLIWVHKKLKSKSGKALTVTDDDMIHVMDYSEDGIRGIAKAKFACDSIELALNAQKHASLLYKNQMWGPGYLKFNEPLTTEQKQETALGWEVNLTGEANAGTVGVLDNGAEYKQYGSNLKDSEYSNIVNEANMQICRFMGMPPSLVGLRDGTNVSYNSLEQDNIAYVQNALMPRATAWEEEFERKLIFEDEREQMSIVFEFKSRLKGDLSTRSNFYDMAFRHGAISINDFRRLEDMDTIGPEGDERYVNGANVPLSKLYSGELDNNDQSTPDKEIKKLLNGIKLNGNGIEKIPQHTS